MQRASLERSRTLSTWRAHVRTHEHLPLCRCDEQPGRFRKGQRVGGCGKPRCWLCHYSKLRGLLTLSERRAIARLKEGLAETPRSDPRSKVSSR